jgi:trans-2,3-dihydro-3-hydroxyanthranilate isomerase
MATSYAYHWLDVFTQERFGGNQLVVFLDARGLSDAQMARIAREFNISETVFLLPPETPGGTRKLRIFTPARELPFAGHPTIGTAHLLATRLLDSPVTSDAELVLEEGVGPVKVAARPQADGTLFVQLSAARSPDFLAVQPPAGQPSRLAAPADVGASETKNPRWDVPALARALSLEPADFETDLPRGFASCGTPFAIVPLRDTDALRRARLDPAEWMRIVNAGALGGITDPHWVDHVYPIARDASLAARGVDLRVRMFAPGLGITEDAATGAAATALAAHLAAHATPERDGTFKWTIEQGIEMERPSLLYLEADKRDGNVTAVRVGGYAVWIGEGQLTI